MARLGLDHAEDVGVDFLDQARGVLRRGLVDGLGLQLDPSKPVPAASSGDLDRPVLVAPHQLPAVLTQDDQWAAVIAVAQPQLRQQLQDPRANRIVVNGLTQEDVDLALSGDRRLSGGGIGAGRQRHGALEKILHIVGRDLHRHQPHLGLFSQARAAAGHHRSS